MSPWLPKATVAIEDSRFWQHGALDYQGIARALYKDVAPGTSSQGGSTITQQLVRNLYIGKPERTLSRKIKEACLAEKLAQTWSKKQILAAYLNEVFYGRHAFGAQAGAQTFFSTSAREADARAGGAPRRAAAGADASTTRCGIPTARSRRRNEVLARDAAERLRSRRPQYARARRRRRSG